MELETQATRQTTQLSQERKVQYYDPDQLTDLIAKIVDIQEEIKQQLQKSYELMAKIEKAIEKLPEREKYLIRARYIEGKTWEQIAVDMGYSWKQVHRIHAKALKLLAS